LMRTVEVIFVIVILLTAFVIATQFAVLPSPSQAYGTNLRELSQSTLETLDADGILSATVFEDKNDPAWGDLQKALSASLPPNIVYNLTVYDLSAIGGVISYQLNHSISDANLGANSDASSLLVTSPEVTFTQDPQKVGESTGQNITLYILNCEDANGWWITGYTGQSLATEFYNLLSPYFTNTMMVNSTADLGRLLNGTLLPDGVESVENSVVINTFGEAVPIPSFLVDDYSTDYSQYCHFLGQKVNTYNWTWVSIVGYPFYYVTNTLDFTGPSDQAWGIYGMKQVGPPGLNAFLEGLTDETVDGTNIMSPVNVVYLRSTALENCSYYGIYPRPYHTASRALYNETLLGDCGLVATELFDSPQDDPETGIDESYYIPAATYTNVESGFGHGALTTIGLTRTPDPRVAALALLMYYRPTVYRSEFEASGTSRLVTLQLSQQGGT